MCIVSNAESCGASGPAIRSERLRPVRRKFGQGATSGLHLGCRACRFWALPGRCDRLYRVLNWRVPRSPRSCRWTYARPPTPKLTCCSIIYASLRRHGHFGGPFRDLAGADTSGIGAMAVQREAYAEF